MLRIQDGKENFAFEAGAIAGYNFRTNTKAMYSIAGADYKVITDGDFNVEPWKLALRARITYKSFGLYGNYSLTPILNGTKVQNNGDFQQYSITPFEVGLTLDI